MGAFNANINTPKARGTSQVHLDETYDLRGLDLTNPDPVASTTSASKVDNFRMYAREADDKRSALRSRNGSRRLSTPVGETLNVQNVATYTSDIELSWDNWQAIPFTPSSTGRLTKLELGIKDSSRAGGYIMVEIRGSGASPGALITQSSLVVNTMTTSFSYVPAYFIDAPLLTSGEDYWILVKTTKYDSSSYQLQGTAGSTALKSTDKGVTYSSLGSNWRYKTYLSTNKQIKGFHRRHPSNNTNKRTMIAVDTDMYAVADDGTTTSISSAIHASSTVVRFEQVDDKTMWVDGKSAAKWWDGTTVSDITNVAGTPTHIIIHKGRAFFVPSNDPTRVNFSGLYNFESYRAVDFFYVDKPKSPDHIAGWVGFQDNLVIFTHETKYTVYGYDIASFTMKQSIGTKGAVSQEAIVADRNYIYFMADDKQIYRYNGVEDQLLSERVEPLLNSISDTSKVRLHLYRNQLRIYYASTPDTEAEDMLLLELPEESSNKLGQWFKDTGRPVMGSIEWALDNNNLIEFSSKVGALYYGEIDPTDLGKPISLKYWTTYKPYSSGASKDRIKKFRLFVRPEGRVYDLSISKDVDYEGSSSGGTYKIEPAIYWDMPGRLWDEDGQIWDDVEEFTTIRVPMSGRGYMTQYRFEADDIGAQVRILGYSSLVKTGRVR